MPITQDGVDEGPTEEDGPPKAPIKSGFTLEASVRDAWGDDEEDDEFVLGGPTAGAKCSVGGGTSRPRPARATDRAYAPIARGDLADDK